MRKRRPLTKAELFSVAAAAGCDWRSVEKEVRAQRRDLDPKTSAPFKPVRGMTGQRIRDALAHHDRARRAKPTQKRALL